MSLTPTELYFEQDYIESGYVGGIADPKIIFTPYFEEGYIEQDYVENAGVIFGFAADLTEAIQQGEAALTSAAIISITGGRLITGAASLQVAAVIGTVDEGDNLGTVSASIIASGEILITDAFNASMSVNAIRTTDTLLNSEFNFSVTASVITSGESLLSYFAALDAQAARTADLESALNSSANILVDPAVAFDAAANFVSTSSIIAAGGPVILASADFSTTSAVSAAAIKYVSRFNDSIRPINFNYFNASGNALSYSGDETSLINPPGALLSPLTENYLRSDLVDLPQRFAVDIVVYNTYDFADTYPITVFTYGNPNSPALLLQLIKEGSNITWRFSYRNPITNQTLAVVTSGLPAPTGQTIETGFPGVLTEWKIRNHDNFIRVEFVKRRGTTITENSDRFSSELPSEAPPLPNSADRYFQIPQNPYDFALVDEFSLHDLTDVTAFTTPSLSDYQQRGLDFNDPYTAFPNDDNTIAFHSFSNTLNDDTSIVFTDSPTLNSNTGVEALAGVAFEASADLTAFYSQVSVTGFVSDFFVNADVAADIAAQVERIRDFAATQNSQFVLSAELDVVKEARADLTVSASMVTEINVIKNAEADLIAFYSQVAAAGAVGDFFVNMDSSASISTVADRTRLNSALLTANTVQVAVGNITRSIGAELENSAGVSADINRIVQLSSSVQGNSEIAVVARRIRDHSAELNSEFGAVIDAGVIPGQSFEINSEFALSASATVIRSSAATLNTQSSVEALAGVAFQGAADLTGFVSIISINKILNVDQYVYMVPRETRTFGIQKETRVFKIQQEIRTYSIRGDS